MKKPKLRIKRVFAKVLENRGCDIGKAMLEEGYAPNTAKNPMNITESKSWEMLLEKELPDELLTDVAKDGLRATMVKTSLTEPDRTLPDYSVRQRYLETALKMKGRLISKVEFKNVDEELDKIKTDYDKFSREIKEQIVEDDTSLQDKE